MIAPPSSKQATSAHHFYQALESLLLTRIINDTNGSGALSRTPENHPQLHYRAPSTCAPSCRTGES